MDKIEVDKETIEGLLRIIDAQMSAMMTVKYILEQYVLPDKDNLN